MRLSGSLEPRDWARQAGFSWAAVETWQASPDSRRPERQFGTGRASQLSLFDPAPPERRSSSTSTSGPPMRCCVLGSGSGGNSVVVEQGGRGILLDAGFSARELKRRLATVSIAPDAIEAVVLTHEHADHCRGVRRFARLCDAEVLATHGTLRGAELRDVPARGFRTGCVVECGGFLIESVSVSHDAREPVGLIVEGQSGERLGLVADLGEPSWRSWTRLRELDVLLLEANHDPDMLRDGPYPARLKRRVAGRRGHLSNRVAADALVELLDDDLHTVVLYHLSRTNNAPALAHDTVAERIEQAGARLQVQISDQFEPMPWVQV